MGTNTHNVTIPSNTLLVTVPLYTMQNEKYYFSVNSVLHFEDIPIEGSVLKKTSLWEESTDRYAFAILVIKASSLADPKGHEFGPDLLSCVNCWKLCHWLPWEPCQALSLFQHFFPYVHVVAWVIFITDTLALCRNVFNRINYVSHPRNGCPCLTVINPKASNSFQREEANCSLNLQPSADS